MAKKRKLGVTPFDMLRAAAQPTGRMFTAIDDYVDRTVSPNLYRTPLPQAPPFNRNMIPVGRGLSGVGTRQPSSNRANVLAGNFNPQPQGQALDADTGIGQAFTRGLIPGDYNARQTDELFREGRPGGLQRMMREGQQFSGGALAEMVGGRPEAERRSIENRLFQQGQMGPAATNNYTGRIYDEITGSMFQSPRQPGVGFNAMRGAFIGKDGIVSSGDRSIVPTSDGTGIRVHPVRPDIDGMRRVLAAQAGQEEARQRAIARPAGHAEALGEYLMGLSGTAGTSGRLGMPGSQGPGGPSQSQELRDRLREKYGLGGGATWARAGAQAQNSPAFQAELDARRAAAGDRGMARADMRGVRTGRMSPLEAALGTMQRSGMDQGEMNPMTLGMMFGPQAAIGAMTNQRETAESLRSEANKRATLDASVFASMIEAGFPLDKATAGLSAYNSRGLAPLGQTASTPSRDPTTAKFSDEYVESAIMDAPQGADASYFQTLGVLPADIRKYKREHSRTYGQSVIQGFFSRNLRKKLTELGY